jgi:hypothetical protein
MHCDDLTIYIIHADTVANSDGGGGGSGDSDDRDDDRDDDRGDRDTTRVTQTHLEIMVPREIYTTDKRRLL